MGSADRRRAAPPRICGARLCDGDERAAGAGGARAARGYAARRGRSGRSTAGGGRSEEHTSELQSLMRISYAVFCLKKKNTDIRSLINKMIKDHDATLYKHAPHTHQHT